MILSLDTSSPAILANEPANDGPSSKDAEFGSVFDERSAEREPRDDAASPGWMPVQPASARYAMPGSGGSGFMAGGPPDTDAAVEGSATTGPSVQDFANDWAVARGVAVPPVAVSDAEVAATARPDDAAASGGSAQDFVAGSAILDTDFGALGRDGLQSAVSLATPQSVQTRAWNAARMVVEGMGAAPVVAAMTAQVVVIRAIQPAGALAERPTIGATANVQDDQSTTGAEMLQDGGDPVGVALFARVGAPQAAVSAPAFALSDDGPLIEALLLDGQPDGGAGSVPHTGTGVSAQSLTALPGIATVIGGSGVALQVAATLVGAAQVAGVSGDRVEVILSPEELGRVQIDFRVETGGMRVILTAERPDTLDLLRRHADQLSADLRDAGFAGASLSFGQGGSSQRGADENAPQLLAPHGKSDDAGPSRAAYRPGGSSRQGLDLRI